MKARVVAVVAVVAVAGCRGERAQLGEPCDHNEGPWCDNGMTCWKRACVTYEDERRLREEQKAARRAAERKADAEKQLRQIKEAGGTLPAAETVDAGAAVPEALAAPGAVRVVELGDKGFALASCRAGERLIGGGCEGHSLVANRPASHSKTDTIGARWECRSSNRRADVKAYALCTPVK